MDTGRLVVAARNRSRSDNGKSEGGPLVVIDNYDSFTYNLSQVTDIEKSVGGSLCPLLRSVPAEKGPNGCGCSSDCRTLHIASLRQYLPLSHEAWLEAQSQGLDVGHQTPTGGLPSIPLVPICCSSGPNVDCRATTGYVHWISED